MIIVSCGMSDILVMHVNTFVVAVVVVVVIVVVFEFTLLRILYCSDKFISLSTHCDMRSSNSRNES